MPSYDPNRFALSEARRDRATNKQTEQVCQDLARGDTSSSSDDPDYWAKVCGLGSRVEGAPSGPRIQTQYKVPGKGTLCPSGMPFKIPDKKDPEAYRYRTLGHPQGFYSHPGIHPAGTAVSEGNPYVSDSSHLFPRARGDQSRFNYRPNRNGRDWTDDMYGQGMPISIPAAGMPLDPTKRPLYQQVSEQAFKPMVETRISTGVMVNPWDGSMYETFEEGMFVPDFKKDQSLSRADLAKTSSKLVAMQGGYDNNNPPPRKVELPESDVQGPDAGRNPWGEQIYAQPLGSLQQHYIKRDLFFSRNDEVPVQPLDDKQSMNYIGYNENVRFTPHLTPTQRGRKPDPHEWKGGPDLGSATPDGAETRVLGPGEFSKRRHENPFSCGPARAMTVSREDSEAVPFGAMRDDFGNTARASQEGFRRLSGAQGEHGDETLYRQAEQAKIRARFGESEDTRGLYFRNLYRDDARFVHGNEKYDPYRAADKEAWTRSALKNPVIQRDEAGSYVRPEDRQDPLRKTRSDYEKRSIQYALVDGTENFEEGTWNQSQKDRPDPVRASYQGRIRERSANLDSQPEFDGDARTYQDTRNPNKRLAYNQRSKTFLEEMQGSGSGDGPARKAKKDRPDPVRSQYNNRMAQGSLVVDRGEDMTSSQYLDDPESAWEMCRMTRKQQGLPRVRPQTAYREEAGDHGAASFGSNYHESQTDRRGVGREDPYLSTSFWSYSAFQSNDRVIFKDQFSQGRRCNKDLNPVDPWDRGADFTDFETTAPHPDGLQRESAKRPDDSINRMSGYAYGVEAWDD